MLVGPLRRLNQKVIFVVPQPIISFLPLPVTAIPAINARDELEGDVGAKCYRP